MTDEPVSGAKLEEEIRQVFEWGTVPYWFAAVAGLIYATGYLVAYTFDNAFGITLASVDAFKAKYIFVGLLCLQFPVSIAFILFGFLWAKREQRALLPSISMLKAERDELRKKIENAKEDLERSGLLRQKLDETLGKLRPLNSFRVNEAYIAAVAGLLFVFYLTTTFVRPGDWPRMQLPVMGLFISIILIITAIRRVEEVSAYFFGDEFLERKNVYLIGHLFRWMLVILQANFTYNIARKPLGLMWVALQDGGYFYVGFVFLSLVMFYFIHRYGPHFRERGCFGALVAINGSLAFSFIYLSILSYAYHIYPYIPSNRGGGDFSADRRVAYITYTKEAVGSVPIPLIQAEFVSPRLTLLEETPNAIYVTTECETKARERWRLVGPENKPNQIFALKKEIITSILYWPIKAPPPDFWPSNDPPKAVPVSPANGQPQKKHK